jgi:ribosome-binding protein aMBF1 (putative translation factor)
VERVAPGGRPRKSPSNSVSADDREQGGVRRHAKASEAGLLDRSSRTQRIPQRVSHKVEKQVLAARQRSQRGAAVLAAELGLNPSAVGRSVTSAEVVRGPVSA